MIVVSDAGPLIALAKINALDLLANLYGKVYTSQSVYDETVTGGLALGTEDVAELQLAYQQGLLEVASVDIRQASTLNLPKLIHPGELDSISLALQLQADLLLIDDWDARQIAEANFQQLNAKAGVKGTLGIIVTACQNRILNLQRAIELLETIKFRRDIWVSAELCDRVIDTVRTISW
jgi:predicted nucleic acid-binding protein